MTLVRITERETLLQRTLERLGWELRSCEIDTVAQTLRIELEGEGRLVTLDVRNGRASLTRERLVRETTAVGRRGDRQQVDRLRTEFLGRQRYTDAREALQGMCDYLGDNAPKQALSGGQKRLLLSVLSTLARD